MNTLKLIQMISNISFVYIIGFPLIIMISKANEWESEFGKHYSLRVFNSIFAALMVSSFILFDRINLVAAFVLFGLAPTLVLFNYQIKEYEPSFDLMKTLKSKKLLLIILLLSIIMIPVSTHLTANELLERHSQLIERYLKDPDNLTEYNLYALAKYNEKEQDYYEGYEPEFLIVKQKDMNQIILADTGHTPDVLFFYRLDKLYWKLEGIH